MYEAAGAPLQLIDGARAAAQSTDAAALRHILQARPLALRLHRERAIGDKSTVLCAVDLHGRRAQRKDNRRPRMLARKRSHRASCSPGGGRPSSPPERHAQGILYLFFSRPRTLGTGERIQVELPPAVINVTMMSSHCGLTQRARRRHAAPTGPHVPIPRSFSPAQNTETLGSRKRKSPAEVGARRRRGSS